MAPTEDPIGLFVTKSARAVNRAFDEALAAEGGTLPSWLVLASLAGGLRRSQKAMAAELGIDGATLTHHLNRMEVGGLVSRERAPHDKRTQQVELTEAGREEFGNLLQTVIAFDGKLRQGLTKAELVTLRDLLGRLAANAAPAATGTTATTGGTSS